MATVSVEMLRKLAANDDMYYEPGTLREVSGVKSQIVPDTKRPNEEYKNPIWLQKAGNVYGHSLRPTQQFQDPQPGLR